MGVSDDEYSKRSHLTGCAPCFCGLRIRAQSIELIEAECRPGVQEGKSFSPIPSIALDSRGVQHAARGVFDVGMGALEGVGTPAKELILMWARLCD